MSCGSALNLDELHYGIFKCLKRRQVDFLVSKEASLLIQEYSEQCYQGGGNPSALT